MLVTGSSFVNESDILRSRVCFSWNLARMFSISAKFHY